MASNLQPLIVYSCGPAPNPYKVAFVLEELGLPWKFESLPLPDLKKEPYTNLNPNGRVPTLVDPNKDIVIWEVSGFLTVLINMPRELLGLIGKFQVRCHRRISSRGIRQRRQTPLHNTEGKERDT